jgi:HAE1 family hydrophobic/amphiphilic exporter-1
MQAAQDITIGGRVSKTMYQYTLNDADPGELNHWAGLFLDRIKAVPGVTDVATDQLNAGPMLDITIKREVASSYGILPYTIDNTLDDAFGQRIVSTMYTTLNQYHVIMEVNPKFQYSPEALNGIYVKSSSGRAARGQPPGPVPIGDDLVQPRARYRHWPSDDCDPAD